MEDVKRMSKAEFLEKWKADRDRKLREKMRMHRYLTHRHNTERLNRLIKKRGIK